MAENLSNIHPLQGLIDGMYCAGCGVMSYYYYLNEDTVGFVGFLICAVVFFLVSLVSYSHPALITKRKNSNFTWVILGLMTIMLLSIVKEGHTVAILGWALVTLSYNIDVFIIRWDSGKNDTSD